MHNYFSKNICFQIFFLLYMSQFIEGRHTVNDRLKYYRIKTTKSPFTKTICMQIKSPLRAQHKSCFLRPDTGPCRADLLQWYFDGTQRKCYRFFWGGCQGNGNKFETKEECLKYCFLNESDPPKTVPHFCSLSFDYGTCFGYYNRWAFDNLSKSCHRRLYSGCGGNQNNFETEEDCSATCIKVPENTLTQNLQYTTCIPFDVYE